jgi:hypothetical protein
MRVKVVASEFEANLWGEAEPGFFSKLFGWKPKRTFGEIEVKSYRDGTKKMEVEFKRLKLPENSTLTIVINGEVLCDVLLAQTDFFKKVFESDQGSRVPDVDKGAKVEVLYQGGVLLEGVFLRD